MEYAGHSIEFEAHLDVHETQSVDPVLPSDISSLKSSSGRVLFNYVVEKTYHYLIHPFDGSDPRRFPDQEHTPSSESFSRFITRRTLVSSAYVARTIIGEHLLKLLVHFSPVDIEPFVDKIIEFSQEACLHVTNADKGIIPITARIRVDYVRVYDERRWIDMETSNAYGMIPASEKSVKELKIKKLSESDSCVICMEDVPADTEAACLPCSHAFHEECIMNWLKNSHSCPICRFKMPVDNENGD